MQVHNRGKRVFLTGKIPAFKQEKVRYIRSTYDSEVLKTIETK